MKYMGSKRELLEEIDVIVRANIFPGDVVLDLFAGTCGVGMYLSDRHPIYSNDIQCYSSAISRGIIETPSSPVNREQIALLLEAPYRKNVEYLTERLSNLIETSRGFRSIRDWGREELDAYTGFIRTLPNPTDSDISCVSRAGRWLTDAYVERRRDPALFPYLQTTFLFSEMYFSLEQAIEIDSHRYAIDSLPQEHDVLVRMLMPALIHAFSYASAGTGHFAQFRDLATLESVRDVFIYRNKSVREYFLRKAEEIVDHAATNAYPEKSRSFSLDYRELLSDDGVMGKVNLVYADPPYSFVHYSRFYHATEDLCAYDYPSVTHKGRYRTDRHQSPFCIKTQAPGAFRAMMSLVRPYRIPLLISYSNTGMITLGLIMDIAREEGYSTCILELAHKHSTMGRQKDKDRDVTEALILCS